MKQCKVCGDNIHGTVYGLEYWGLLWCSCMKCKYKLHAKLDISAEHIANSDAFVRDAMIAMRKEAQRNALIEEREREAEEARIRLWHRSDYAGRVPRFNVRKVNMDDYEE